MAKSQFQKAKLLQILDMLKEKAKKCNDFEYKIIENTNHFYFNKESEIGYLILEWIKKHIKLQC